MKRDHRRLAAIVAVDAVGYSRLMGRDESGTLAKLKTYRRELIDCTVSEHGGRIVKTMGDGLLLEFPSVVDAVLCAVVIQRALAERNAGIPTDQRLDFRVGINVGDIIVDGDDIFGDSVNIAARLQALAERGGICASRAVRDQVINKLRFEFEVLGARHVKNIAQPISAYRVDFQMDEKSFCLAEQRRRLSGHIRRFARPLGAIALGLIASLATWHLPLVWGAVSQQVWTAMSAGMAAADSARLGTPLSTSLLGSAIAAQLAAAGARGFAHGTKSESAMVRGRIGVKASDDDR